MRDLRKWFSVIVAALLLSGCIGQAPEVEKKEVVFTFGSSGDAVRLDPADVTDGESIQRTDNIYESLVRYKEESTEVEPCLAERWDISADGLEFTFYLRKGVKFHDGTEMTADDVVFSFERQYNADHWAHGYGEWAYWGWMFYDVDHVEKIDDYTVKIVLSQPNASILTSLAMFTVSIVSEEAAKEWGEDFFSHPVGTGPFKFVEWIKDDHITLEAFDDYWGGRAKIDKLIFRVIPDTSARLLALEKGEIDGMEYPNPDDLDRINANPDLVLMTQPGMNTGYLAINTGWGYNDENGNGVFDPDTETWVRTEGAQDPLMNVLVRRAIAHAIDKKSIVENLYRGTAIPAKTIIPPLLFGYNDAIVDYEYNPEKSKQLLVDAGYPDGFETVLWVMPVSRPYMFDPPKIGEAIQSYLAAVGIKAEIYQVEWGTYLQETEAGKHPMCLLGWTGDNGDPDNFINVLCGPNSAIIGAAGNVAFYNNMEVQDLLTKALRTYDKDERIRLYKQAEAIIHEDVPWIFLAHATQMLVFRKNVHGYKLHPTSRKFFYPVWIEEG
ncbi:MAG: ABC transporter substrate-binding protein [Candidatus Methanofastidiosia archaeon]